jgi:O-6-methylguanine DNA methyltransferase
VSPKQAAATDDYCIVNSPVDDLMLVADASARIGVYFCYSYLAKRAGAPRAIRAAGTGTGRNPAAIFVPCHRVVGKNRSMGGFGGGLDRKRFLLGLTNCLCSAWALRSPSGTGLSATEICLVSSVHSQLSRRLLGFGRPRCERVSLGASGWLKPP